jgi:hypothetical protein
VARSSGNRWRRFEVQFQRFLLTCQSPRFALTLARDVEFQTLGDVRPSLPPNGHSEWSIRKLLLSQVTSRRTTCAGRRWAVQAISVSLGSGEIPGYRTEMSGPLLATPATVTTMG